MVDIKQKAYSAAAANCLTTELNTLAAGSASAAGPAQGGDATNADEVLDFEFLTGGSITPATGTRYDLYLLRAVDGTNYEDVTTGSSESLPPDAYVGSFVPTSGAATKRVALRDVPSPPGLWKAVLMNEGVTLPASGNTVKFRGHSHITV
jgi:hypothetical protein